MAKISKKILFSLALLAIILPLSAQAFIQCGIGDIGGIVLSFFIRIATAIVGILAIVFSYLALALYIVGVAISSWFIVIALEVPIVDSWARDVGWTLTRNLVNMTFIIILAWIGIATILRLREYRTGKIFLNLILIALLVNFSPVLVGVVVDISNIIANFFLSNMISTNTLGEFIATQIAPRAVEMAEAFGKIYIGNLQEAVGSFMQILGYGLFFFFGSFVFGILALLFFLRTLAFWILLILAPIAFICYILPATKRYWRMWWSQLIQWALVGVIASFFLYLSLTFLDAATNTKNPNYLGDTWGSARSLRATLESQKCEGRSAFTKVGITAVTAMFPVLASLIFMSVGVFMSFTGAAAAGRMIERHVPKAVRTRGKKIWQWVKSRTRSAVGRRMPERVRRRLESWGTAPSLRERLRTQTTIGGITREVALAPLTWGRRRIGRLAIGATEAQVQEIKKLEAEFGKIETPEKMLQEIRTGSIPKRIAALRAGIEKKMMRRLEELGLTDQEIINLAREATRIRPELAEKILKANTHLATQIANVISPEAQEQLDLRWRNAAEQAQYGTLERKITAKLTTQEIPKLNLREVLANPETMRGIAEFWKGSKIGSAARAFEDDFVEPYMDEVKRVHQALIARGVALGFEALNADAWNYLDTNAAREFGLKRP